MVIPPSFSVPFWWVSGQVDWRTDIQKRSLCIQPPVDRTHGGGHRGTCLDTAENSQQILKVGNSVRQVTLFLPEVNSIKMGRGRCRVAET